MFSLTMSILVKITNLISHIVVFTDRIYQCSICSSDTKLLWRRMYLTISNCH
nr:MAG TPA: hypothetical protein [Podoviridae sp. ctY3D12]